MKSILLHFATMNVKMAVSQVQSSRVLKNDFTKKIWALLILSISTLCKERFEKNQDVWRIREKTPPKICFLYEMVSELPIRLCFSRNISWTRREIVRKTLISRNFYRKMVGAKRFHENIANLLLYWTISIWQVISRKNQFLLNVW